MAKNEIETKKSWKLQRKKDNIGTNTTSDKDNYKYIATCHISNTGWKYEFLISCIGTQLIFFHQI